MLGLSLVKSRKPMPKTVYMAEIWSGLIVVLYSVIGNFNNEKLNEFSLLKVIFFIATPWKINHK